MRIDSLAAHPSLWPTVAEWQHEQFGHFNPALTLAQRIERFGRQAEDAGSLPFTLVALSDAGEALGTASLVQTTLTHQHLTPWLSAVFVPRALRGQGIASALILRLVDEAAQRGFDKLYLFTPSSESLYARWGWQSFDQSLIGATSVSVMVRQCPPRMAAAPTDAA